jgi:hypothetical protein
MNLKLLFYYLAFLLATLILTGCSHQNTKDSPKKLALLIANEQYIRGSEYDPLPLDIVKKDVKNIATALKRAGFTAFIYHDLPTKDNMKKAVNYFISQAQRTHAEVVWLYYAGHGIQQLGKNYLIPTQVAKTGSTEELQAQAMTAQEVMTDMQNKLAKTTTKILVLDTCRGQLKPEENNLTLVGGGDNVIVVFSTSAGNFSPNVSPLAKYLVAGIKQTPWQPLEDLLQEVGRATREEYSKSSEFKDNFVYVYGWAGRRFCLSRCLDTQHPTINP